MDTSRIKMVPRALHKELSPIELAEDNPCDGVRALGSYWTGTEDIDLQCRLAKYFKAPSPNPLNRPCISAIARAYADMIVELAREWRPDAVLRVLSSGEIHPNPMHANSYLIRLVSEALGVPDFTHIFFRTEPRKPMRMVTQLSGADVMRRRIGYVLQDLFIAPCRIGRTVLIVDDISNLGATTQVYAAALKQFCGAERVYSVNIAAARFAGGKDGWGYLALDIDRFASLARGNMASNDPKDSFDDVWIEAKTLEFHITQDCRGIKGKAHRSFRFLALEDRVPCPICTASDRRGTIRRWLNRKQ